MKYDVICADPPWLYNARANTGSFRGGACQQYELLSTADIAELDVASIAADDAMLFMWITGPLLFANKSNGGVGAADVMRAWGFEYVTIAFSWIKTNKKAPTPWFGIGYYTKSNVELVLLGKRGKGLGKPATDHISQVLDHRDPTVEDWLGQEEVPTVIAPRGEHSAKPEEIQDRIEYLYPGRNYVELFARRQRPGWSCIGNDIDGLDIRDALPLAADGYYAV